MGFLMALVTHKNVQIFIMNILSQHSGEIRWCHNLTIRFIPLQMGNPCRERLRSKTSSNF